MEIPTCFKNEYLTDKDFGDAFRALKSLNPTTVEMNMFASYTVTDELLYYLDRICVPHNGALRKILIQEHHEVPFAAHPGINKTYRLLSATYFWPQMQQDVIKYVKACHSCQIMKASRQLPQGLLQPLPIPKERWESINMDFITTLPRTSKGNAQILVIVNRFSKMAHFIPCKKAASAPDIASLFVQHIFRIHGLPVSDRDPKFTGHFWTSLFKSLGTNLLFSSAYHPQTDGQTERVNQILEEMLRHYIHNRLASWEEYLPLVEFAYNNAPHSVTGMTPFQAAYGHTPLVPTNFVLQHKVALADQLVQEMQDILVQVRDKLIHVQQKYQKQANKHRRHAEFNEDDMVLLYVASHRYKTVKAYQKKSPVKKLLGKSSTPADAENVAMEGGKEVSEQGFELENGNVYGGVSEQVPLIAEEPSTSTYDVAANDVLLHAEADTVSLSGVESEWDLRFALSSGPALRLSNMGSSLLAIFHWQLETQIADLLRAGFIRLSSSPFAAPVLFVMKKDKSARLCVDYKALNKLMIKNKFLMPRIKYILERLDGAKFFIKIDLKSGYH
ncbi:hypothetical protein L7F22_037350 [Adiantum nelumboides]|nr:hypothetical protein [Adiantum nelumboides]